MQDINATSYILAITQMQMLRSEYKAIVGVVARSLQLTPREVQQLHMRCFCSRKPDSEADKPRRSDSNASKTSEEKSSVADSTPAKGSKASQASSEKTSDDIKEKEDGSRLSSGSSSGSGEESSNPNNNKNNENDEKMRSVLTKAVLWLFTIYMFVAFISLLITPRTERPEGSTRYVSWNEFVHHMLAVGEVKELIIRPDMEMVTIILHDGAVIKGRKVTSTIFHMAVADANKFEEKLRVVEKRLGITDGIPVTYDRQTDTTGRILMLLLFCALLMSIATRMKSMKSPLSMDSFVSNL